MTQSFDTHPITRALLEHFACIGEVFLVPYNDLQHRALEDMLEGILSGHGMRLTHANIYKSQKQYVMYSLRATILHDGESSTYTFDVIEPI